jgi:hypothetical protein
MVFRLLNHNITGERKPKFRPLEGGNDLEANDIEKFEGHMTMEPDKTILIGR